MSEQTIAELNQKIDALTAQVAFLAEAAHLQQRRRQEFVELKDDLIPIGNDLFRLSVEQLDEMESYVQLEDILRLFKRMMRNTRNMEIMLDQLESMTSLWQDLNPLTQDAFMALMNRLNEMEQKGYFEFARGGMQIVDKIVTEFTEDDVQQLGDNVVLILQTVKEMTQPEVMTMMSNTIHVMQEEDEALDDVSMFSILRQMNDPAVKRGLAKTLAVLKSVSDS